MGNEKQYFGKSLILLLIFLCMAGCGFGDSGYKPVPVNKDILGQEVQPLSSDFRFILNTGHSVRIKALAVSPDGKYAVSGDILGIVKFWDLKTCEMLINIDRGNAAAYSAEFSPDGRLLAAGFFDNTVKIWSIPDGRLLAENEDAGSQVAFSPDGKLLACTGMYKPVTLCRVSDLKPVRIFKKSTFVNNTIAFSPDGKFLATGEGDGSVIIWNVETGEIARSLKGHKWWVHSVKFSRDGKMLVSGSYTMKGSVKWQTIQDMDEKDKLEAENDYNRQNWAYDETVVIWDVARGKMIRKFNHPFGALSVDFSPDGKRVASSGIDNTARLWDIESGKEIFHFLIREAIFINNITFTPDGKSLVTAGGDNQVKIIDIDSGKIVLKLNRCESPVESLAFSPDGKSFAASRGDGSVDLWDMDSHRFIKHIALDIKPIQTVNFSRDGRYIAYGENSGSLKIQELATGKPMGLSRQKTPIMSMSLSPDGSSIVSGNADGRVMLWTVPDFKPVWSIREKQAITSLAFSPDGQTILSCSFRRNGEAIKLLNAKNGWVIRNFSGGGHPGWSAVFLNGGKRFAVTRGRKIIIYDINGGKILQELKKHKAPVWAIAVDPGGSFMASGSKDGEIILWDISGPEVKYSGRQSAHDDEVEAIVFSPKEQVFLSGSRDSTVKLWSIADFKAGKQNSGKILKPLAVYLELEGHEWVSISKKNGFIYSRDAYKHVEGAIINGKEYKWSDLEKKGGFIYE